MRKEVFQMSALNEKQVWLCDIMTRLPLIKYIDYWEDGEVLGHLLESPITGRPLCIWWRVECHPVIHRLFTAIWNSFICWDNESESHQDELLRLGWAHVNDNKTPPN